MSMVGIVVVSHSPDLARAAVDLALQMVHGPAPHIEIAAGAGDGRLGTDAARVAEAVVAADDGEGVVVIMDLGSAVLSAELAVDLMPEPRIETRLVSAAFVEGIFAAVVSAAAGAALDDVARDAEGALHAKAAQLGEVTTPSTAAAPRAIGPAIVAEVRVINPEGIHARPAALIVSALAPFDAQVRIGTDRAAPVPARSPIALMSLGAQVGDALRIEADGPDAAAAVDRILTLARGGFGEMRVAQHPLGVSPGRVVGPAARMPDPIGEPDPTIRVPEAERPAAAERVMAAAADVAAQLRGRSASAGAVGELLEATAALATDAELLNEASSRVRDRGLTPERAVWEAFESAAGLLRGLGGKQAERAADLYDVRDRMIASLTGRSAQGVPDPGHPYVLLAVDLAPADTAGLEAGRCLAIVTEEGAPTSHTAILARTLGIPAVVGVPGVTEIAEGTLLLVDGATGEVIREPTGDQQATAADQPAARAVLTGPGSTADGHRVALLANIAAAPDVRAAQQYGAEGVGLYRTELCFLDRIEAPSVAEQVSTYRAVFAAFSGRRVVVRTLDAGSDKQLPFLAGLAEPNPALGVRGIRTAAFHPQLLHDQLHAIREAAAAESAEVWVMAPMITTLGEARNFVAAARDAGLSRIGVMIETPAAVLSTEQILAEVDFVSIGTNDLGQYAFAADRQSSSLAAFNDPWQPALLRMIEMVTAAAVGSGKPVGACGEAAADQLLAPVLAGLGVTSLSMAPGALAEVGRSLTAASMELCRRAARAAADADTPRQARDAARAVLDRRL